MSGSERVTWETCPACGHAAAVGWLGGVPVEFDCPGGCAVPGRAFDPRAAGQGEPPSAVARWAGALGPELAGGTPRPD